MLTHNHEWIFEEWSVDGKVFVRPDSGDKRFTGQLCRKDLWFSEIQKECEFDDSLALITFPKYQIEDINTDEIRAFICGEEVVCKNKEVKTFVEEVLKNVSYRPDLLFSMDVLTSDYLNPKIVEINSFSCAGLYGTDPEELVDAVERAVSHVQY